MLPAAVVTPIEKHESHTVVPRRDDEKRSEGRSAGALLPSVVHGCRMVRPPVRAS
jgi:hypothetical protein